MSTYPVHKEDRDRGEESAGVLSSQIVGNLVHLVQESKVVQYNDHLAPGELAERCECNGDGRVDVAARDLTG